MATNYEQMKRIHDRQLTIMQRHIDTLGHILKRATKDELTKLKDGPEGWSVTQIVCHLRDYEEIFYQRGVQILNSNNPTFAAYDPDQLAAERNYAAEDVHQVYATLVESRKKFMEFLKDLSDEQWDRGGTHPTYGTQSLHDVAQQACNHDSIHLEQITRVLTQAG